MVRKKQLKNRRYLLGTSPPKGKLPIISSQPLGVSVPPPVPIEEEAELNAPQVKAGTQGPPELSGLTNT